MKFLFSLITVVVFLGIGSISFYQPVHASGCTPGFCTDNNDCAADEECVGSAGSCSGECYLKQGNGGGGGGINGKLLEEGYVIPFIAFINGLLVPALIALAFIIFLWGVFKAYILSGGSEESRTKGHQLILWGIIGFAVILSVWGMVAVVVDFFGFGIGGAGDHGLNPSTI
jgi:hypothetical protein